MNTVAKVLVVFILLLSAAFAVSQMALYSKRVQYRKLYEGMKTKFENADALAKQRETELKEAIRQQEIAKNLYERDIAALKKTEEEAKEQVKLLRTEVSDLKADVKLARDQADKYREQADTHKAAADDFRKQTEELKGIITEKEKELADVTKIAEDRKNQITALEEKVVNLENEKLQVIEQRDQFERILASLKAQGIYIPGTEAIEVIDANVVRVDNDLGRRGA
jgi:chromosome segregation ATPase